MIPKFVLTACFLLILAFQTTRSFSGNERFSRDKVVVCYVASWATYRPLKGAFNIDNLRPELCTHLVYAFAGLNTTTWTIRSLDNYLDTSDNYGRDNYRKMTSLKSEYPSLKISIAIGGWNEGSANYSALAGSATHRSIFISSVISFLKKYKFDGLDLDWEFPAKRGGSPNDKANFVLLVQELKSALKARGFILTAAVSADKSTIDDAYDVPEISKHLDYIHVMAYDYHGTWNGRVLPNAPLECDDGLCVNETIKYLITKGAPVEKLVLGLAMYGRTFVLASVPNSLDFNPMGMKSLDKGFRGPFTSEDGFMGYNEICDELRNNTWRTGWDEKGSVPYAVNNDHVIVYDNHKSISLKVAYAQNMKLAGVMVWAIDNDDFHGDCANQHTDIVNLHMGTDFPLMRTINHVLSQNKPEDNENEIYETKNKKKENNTDSENTASAIPSTEIFVTIISCIFILLRVK